MKQQVPPPVWIQLLTNFDSATRGNEVGSGRNGRAEKLLRPWLEALQAEMMEQKAEIQILKNDVNNLERNVESELQKRLHLDFYSQRENLRLVGVKENGDDECVKENSDEDCEKLARNILDEMVMASISTRFIAYH